MARRIVNLPDGATPEQTVSAVLAVAGEIEQRWTSFTPPDGRASTGRDLTPVVADLLDDMATMSHLLGRVVVLLSDVGSIRRE